MKTVLKGAIAAVSAGLALFATQAHAQLGAVRSAPKASAPAYSQPSSQCRGKIGQTLLLSAPFRGRYRAEEQRFELWYHDLIGKGQFSSYDADRYLTLGVFEAGYSRSIGTQWDGDLTLKSRTTYDLEGFDMTGPRPKRRAFDFPFAPEPRLSPPRGGSEVRYGETPRPGSKKALNRLRWYLDMPGAEAQANHKAMKWVYQVDAKSVSKTDGVSSSPGSANARFFNQKIISGQLSCAMIVDRNNVVKKVFLSR